MTKNYSAQASPPSLMEQLIASYTTGPALYVAAKLEIADLIAQSPKTADELAHETKCDPRSLNRVLLVLTSIGIFAADDNGRFHLTTRGEFLRREHPQSQRGFVIMCGSPFFWRPWGELYEAVLHGQSAFERVHTESLFEYLSKHPDQATLFNDGMSSISAREIPAIIAAYDFSGFDRIVDVGGGHGALINAMISANPTVRGVLADLPQVVGNVASSLMDRCEVAGIDFFESIPKGADAYILKYIIHDWNDGDALKILRNCRSAIRHDGRLLLMEHVLKEANEPDLGRGLDLTMLVLSPGGQERTKAQYSELLNEAGFSLIRVIPTDVALSIIESKPV